MLRRRRGSTTQRIGRPEVPRLAALIIALLVMSACTAGGASMPAFTPSLPAGTSSPPTASPPSSPSGSAASPSSPAASPASTTAAPAPAASTPGGSSPSPAVVSLASKLYPYVLTIPGDTMAIAPGLATVAWDGRSRIDSADAQTDWVGLEGDRTLFVYGSPSDASLADFAATSQRQVAEWHGCPDTPESTADISVGGAPARLHLFHCQGLLVMKVMSIRDGFGLVVNQIGPDGDPATEQALLASRIADLRWTSR